MPNLVKVESPAEGVAVVTLNRPKAMNALSLALRRALFDAITTVDADDEIRAVVLTGAGDRAFSAGLDLKELGANAENLSGATAPEGHGDPVRTIEACRKPVIAAVNGVAITGGFEVALACDMLIASTRARFADTHGRVGILPGWGLSQKLSRLIGIGRAKELSFTGNFLDAQTAWQWGLVNCVCEPDELLPCAIGLACDMASMDPVMLTAYKRLIDEGFAMAFGDSIAHERAYSAAANAAVRPEEVEARRQAVRARGRSQ